MLILSRKAGESIVVCLPDGRQVEVEVLEIRGQKVKLGIGGDPAVPVHRAEVAEQLFAEEGRP